MHRPFRFIHASDLHLERPPRGLAEVPEHLRAALVDAPYRAAERIFEAALKERVDFVLLAGDVLDPLAGGPRGLLFLWEQFRRLADSGIKLYWAGGRRDDFERVGDWGPLAEFACRFPVGRVQRVVHDRDGEPLAQILGTSSPQRKKIHTADFHCDGDELFSLAVAYGSAEPDVLSRQAINYWALGGEHDRRTLLTGPITAHYCGTPQGRRPPESGPRGCSLVHVDELRQIRITLVPTDAVRYLSPRVEVGRSTTFEQLHDILSERIGDLSGDPFGPDVLIRWNVVGGENIAADLWHGKRAADLLARLRAEYGTKRPAVWTVAIDPHLASGVPEELYDDQTVLGEFLRTVRHYVENPEPPLNLEPYLAERHLAGSLGSAVSIDEPTIRRRVLAEVARLGVELLGPREPRS